MKTNTRFSNLILLIFILGGQSLFAQTVIPASTISDTMVRWSLQNSPYLIEGDLLIEEGATLLIDTGVIVEFQGNFGISLKGKIHAIGNNNSQSFSHIKFQGRDLGSGRHVLWNGIKIASTIAQIEFGFVDIQDSKIAIDISDYIYWSPPSPNNPFVRCSNSRFFNNQVGIKTTKYGANLGLSFCEFFNNDIGIQGEYYPYKNTLLMYQIQLDEVQFNENRIAVSKGYYNVYACSFSQNDTALFNVFASKVDSTLFHQNGLAVSGHSLNIESSGFTNNIQAVFLNPYDQLADSLITNTSITTSHFENNDTAISMAENHSISEIECNLFVKNLLALSIYSQTSTIGGQRFAIERNTLISNSKAILVNQQTQSSPLFPGASYSIPKMHFNTFSQNPQLFTNRSAEALNLLKNYMEGDQQMLEFGIIDGSDSSLYGLVNYTLSGDTNLVGSDLVVTKIQDIIKHSNYDSTDISGAAFTILRCLPQPGNPLDTKKPEENQYLVFPNPFQSTLNIRWTDGQEYRIYLYNTLGQEIALPNNQAQASPAELHLEGLPKGMYFFLLKNESGSKTFRVVKE